MRFPDGIWVVAIYFAYLGIKKKKKTFQAEHRGNILIIGFAFWKIKLFLIRRFSRQQKTLCKK